MIFIIRVPKALVITIFKIPQATTDAGSRNHDHYFALQMALKTRIAPALLGLREALKISIYDYLPKYHQINFELFLNCYNVIIFIVVSQ